MDFLGRLVENTNLKEGLTTNAMVDLTISSLLECTELSLACHNILEWRQGRINKKLVESLSRLTGATVEIVRRSEVFRYEGSGEFLFFNDDTSRFKNLRNTVVNDLSRKYSAYKTIKADARSLESYILSLGKDPYPRILKALMELRWSVVSKPIYDLFVWEARQERPHIGTLFILSDISGSQLPLKLISGQEVSLGLGRNSGFSYFSNGEIFCDKFNRIPLPSETIPLEMKLIKTKENKWVIMNMRNWSKTVKVFEKRLIKCTTNPPLRLLNLVLRPIFFSDFNTVDLETILSFDEFGLRKTGDKVLNRICNGLNISLFVNTNATVEKNKIIYRNFIGESSPGAKAVYLSFKEGGLCESIYHQVSSVREVLTISGSIFKDILSVLKQKSAIVDIIDEMGGEEKTKQTIKDLNHGCTDNLATLMLIRKIMIKINTSLHFYKIERRIDSTKVECSFACSITGDLKGSSLRIGIFQYNGDMVFLGDDARAPISIMKMNEAKVAVDLSKVVEESNVTIDSFISPPISTFTLVQPKLITVPAEKFNITKGEIERGTTEYTMRGELFIKERAYRMDKTFADSDELDKYPHDIITSEWLETTDKSFRDMGLIMGNPDDSLTPDYISVKKMDDKSVEVRILEVGTTRSQVMSTEYAIKKQKYLRAIEDRASKDLRFSYGILIVNQNGVYTNLSLPDEVAIRMVAYFNYAWKIKKMAQDQKILIEFNNDELESHKVMRQIFSNLNKFEGNDLLTKEDYSNMIKPITIEEEELIMKDMTVRMNNIINGYHGENLTCEARDCEKVRILNKQINQYNKDVEFAKSRRQNHTNNSQKAVVQIPLLEPSASDQFDRDLGNLPKIEYETGETLRNIISAIFNDVSKEGSTLSELDRVCLDPQVQYQLNKKTVSPEDKDFKISYLGENFRNYGKSRPTLDSREVVYLHQRGIEGKKAYLSKDDEVKAYRERKKQWFEPDTPTIDIEEFLKEENLMERVEDKNYEKRIEDKLKLINKGYLINSNAHGSNVTINLARQMLLTRLGRYCVFVTDLGEELASSMTEGMKPGEFRVKKFPHWNDVYLIVKSTGKSGVIFYSIVFKTVDKHDKNFCFKKTTDLGGSWSCTDFVSDEKSSLDNKVKLETLFISLYTYWREHYYLSPDINLDKTAQNRVLELKAFNMLKLSLLVALEDKAKTEEAITNTRYIHLEALVVWPELKNPGKMLEKLNIYCRSRLEVWLNNRAVHLCHYYTNNPPFTVQNDEIVWDRFLNPYCVIDGEDYQNHEQVVNIMYIGYIKNKDQSGFANNSGQMLSKIVEKEDMLRRTPDGKIDMRYIGLEEPGEDKTIHEFSPRFLKYLCKRARSTICKSRGVKKEDYEDLVSNDVLVKLKGVSVDSLATLKKSSQFGLKYYKYRDYRVDKLNQQEKEKKKKSKFKEVEVVEKVGEERTVDGSYHRITNMEAVMDALKDMDKDRPMPNITYLLEESLLQLEEQGCMHIDIFKKNQHGGLREIYVLEFRARVVQRVIEEISRALTSNFEQETMLHPKNKYILPEKENTMCKLELGNFVSYSTSDDASKWSQCHIVTKFIIMLTHLLGNEYHGFIVRALSLWLKKKIKLNDELLDVFYHKNSKGFSDECLNKAYKAFNGEMQLTWMKPGNSYVEIESGMMQGILHVTSSLMHVILLSWLSKYLQTAFRKVFIKTLPLLKDTKRKLSRIMTMCSSDDSEMTISFPILDIPLFNPICKLLAAAAFRFKTETSELLAIHKSIKSTTMTPNFFEFNSEFRFGSSEMKPHIKWVMASAMIAENESFLGIQEDFNSLLSKILEGGGSLFLTAMCQLSQGLLNYRMLGEGLSVLWGVYSDLIMLDPDPTVGFFLMDPPLIPGLAGTKYQVWKASYSSTLNTKFKYFLEESVKKMGAKVLEGTEFSGSLFSRTLFFSVGELIRYKRLLKAIRYDSNSLSSVDEDPRVLYKPSDTVGDIRVKIYAKARMPGVAVSLSGTNTFVTKVASSIYILSRTVCTCKSEVIKDLVYEKDFLTEHPNVKISMLNYLLASAYDVSRTTMEKNDKVIENFIQKKIILKPSGEILSSSVSMSEAAVICAQKLTCRKDENLAAIVYRCFPKRLILASDRLGLISSVYKVNIFLTKDKYYGGCTPDKLYFCSRESSNMMIYWDEQAKKYQTDQLIGDPLQNSGIEEPVLEPSQRLFLFSMASEYEDFDRMTSSYSISHELQTGKNVRMKTRLQQNILWKTNEEIPLLHIVQYKWFGIYKKSMDIFTFERIFEENKRVYTWLDSDPKTTLEKSHFNTQLEMFHFISKGSTRSRTLRINSAFINPNSVTLKKVISRNFSNGLIPSIDKKQDYESVNNNKVIQHLLSCLFAMPLKQEYKIRNIADLLICGLDIIFSTDSKDRRVNSLKLIQKALKENPEVEIDGFQPFASSFIPDILFEYGEREKYEEFRSRIGQYWKDVQKQKEEDQDEYAESKYGYDLQHYIYAYNDESEFRWRYLQEHQVETPELLTRYSGKSGYFQLLKNPHLTQQELKDKTDKFIQEFPKFIKEISQRSVGIFGYYVKPQKYDSGVYKGLGIWMGNIGGIDVKFHLNHDGKDNVLTLITVKTTHYVSVFYSLIQVWCNDHGVVIKTGDWSSGGCADRLNSSFKQSQPSSNQGCRIVVNDNMETIGEQEYRSLRFELNKTGVRLTTTTKIAGVDRQVTLLSTNFRTDNKYILSDRVKVTDRIEQFKRYPEDMRKFINYETFLQSPDLVNEVLSGYDSIYDKEAFIEWASKLIGTSLKQRASDQEVEEMAIAEYNEDDDDDFEVNINQEDFNISWASELQGEIEYESEYQKVQEYALGLAKYISKRDLEEETHPFFQSLVNSIPSHDIDAIIHRKKGIDNAFVTRYTIQFKEILAKVFEIDPDTIMVERNPRWRKNLM